MTVIIFSFWFFLAVVCFAYAGYALITWVFNKAGYGYGHSYENNEQLLQVTLVVPAYNEEGFIEEKIKNCLTLDYPANLIACLFVTDGSTDATPDVVRRYPQVKLMHQPERGGKIAAMNRVMKTITTPVVIFCDANTLLNPAAVRWIVRHYHDPQVGGVAGEKKVVGGTNENIAGTGEGLYWKYESFLKQLDSDFYSVVGAAGELFSFRTHLYDPVEPDTLLDDFVISLRICQKGYRVIYEPNAYAVEQPSFNLEEERKRKVRISTGGFQAISRLTPLLQFFRHPRLTYLYVSHRVLRWAVCPFLLPLIFLLNIWLVAQQQHSIYTVLLWLQVFFYVAAFAGWLLSKAGKSAKAFTFAYYFLFMNLSLYSGFFRYVSGGQSVMWEKARRAV